jgi:thiol-disulfide isomerase/thioredoxin
LRSKEDIASSGPGKYDVFTQCLKDKGATFYGAYWCPHCKSQKALFGSSVKFLPYVECSTPDGANQTQICIEKKVVSYPTWEFLDGTRLTGEIPLLQLAEKTSCELPQ